MGPPQMAPPPPGHDGAVNTTSALLPDTGGLSAPKTMPPRKPRTATKATRILYRPMIWTDLGRSGTCSLIWPPRESRRLPGVVSNTRHDTTCAGKGPSEPGPVPRPGLPPGNLLAASQVGAAGEGGPGGPVGAV